MDASRLGSGPPTTKVPDLKVQELSSEEESDIENALLAAVHPRVNGANGVHDLDALDDSGVGEDSQDGWDDADSLFEDTIEEMGDEHLFDGGEQSWPWPWPSL